MHELGSHSNHPFKCYESYLGSSNVYKLLFMSSCVCVVYSLAYIYDLESIFMILNGKTVSKWKINFSAIWRKNYESI